MDAEQAGFLFFDVVSSAGVRMGTKVTWQDALQSTLKVAAPYSQDIALHGDGGILTHPKLEGAYVAFRLFAKEWITRNLSAAPVMAPSIRFYLTAWADHRRSKEPLPFDLFDASYKRTRHLPPDYILISYAAHERLKPTLVRDGLEAIVREIASPYPEREASYAISLYEAQPDRRYLSRIEAPTDLINELNLDPKLLFRIDPRKFEEVIAELLSSLGYSVELTKQTRDHGVDIVAFSKLNSLLIPQKYLIQCKRNAPKNKVGIGVVRSILGAGAENPSTGLIVATTSTFTRPAVEYANLEAIRWRLHLKDYDDIRQWLIDYSTKKHF